MRLGIVGVGRAGTFLGRAFQAAGHPVAAVWDVDSGKAGAIARDLGASVQDMRSWSSLKLNAVILAVPDRRIADVAGQMAAGGKPAPVALHLSGACEASELGALSKAGCAVASMHPLRSFTAVAPGSEPTLRGTRFALQGECEAVRVARRLAESVGGLPFEIGAGQKAAYHAAAGMCSNYAVVLAWLARDVSRSAGVPPDAWEGYLELMRGTIDNLSAVGPEEALTGPVARGDWQTVARHRNALSGFPPAWDAYRAMALAAARLAFDAGILSGGDFDRISRVLNGGMED